jgi:hypothetical protein
MILDLDEYHNGMEAIGWTTTMFSGLWRRAGIRKSDWEYLSRETALAAFTAVITTPDPVNPKIAAKGLPTSSIELFPQSWGALNHGHWFSSLALRRRWEGITRRQWRTLTRGRGTTGYQSTWNNVLASAVGVQLNNARWTIHRDEDIWMFPEGAVFP